MNFSILGKRKISWLINGYNTFLKNNSDVCNFAKLVDLHFRQRMKLKFDMSLLLFWFTSWLMDKVTKFSPRPFYSFPRLPRRRSCDQEIQNYKYSRIEFFNNKESLHRFLLRLFNELAPLFSPQIFLKISTSTTIIKTWVTPLLCQSKYRWCPGLPRRKKCRYCLRPWYSLPSLPLYQTTPSLYPCFLKKSY